MDRGEQGGLEWELAALFFWFFVEFFFVVEVEKERAKESGQRRKVFSSSINLTLDGPVRHDLVPQHVQLPRGEACTSATGAVARARRRRRRQGRRREVASR